MTFDGSHWRQEASDALKAYVDAGDMSYSRIAASLNSRFGTSYSRNACIGRAKRMGFSNPGKKIVSVGRRYPSAQKKPDAHKRTTRFNPPPADPVEIILRAADVEPLNVPLIDLGPMQCRFPYGDGPFTFCAHPTLEADRSYCPPHHQLARKSA